MANRCAMASISLALLLAGCAHQEGPPTGSISMVESAPPIMDPTLIVLSRPLHFTGAGGEDLLVRPGSYQVAQAEATQLRLVSTQDGSGPTIQAVPVDHDLDLRGPFALLMPMADDATHLVLLNPDGKALEAVGSESGVRGRGPSATLGKATIALGVQSTVLSRPSAASALGPGTRLRVFDYQLAPSPGATGFGGCTKSAGWVSAAVAESHVAPAGSATSAGPGTATGYNPFPPGSPWGRGAFPGYHCAFGSVTITPPPATKLATGNHRLLVTSYVYTAGGTLLSLMVTDVYDVAPGNWTLPQVILATGRTATTPQNYDYGRVVTQYYASLPTGSPAKFELQVDGVSVADKNCLLKASMTQAATLTCHQPLGRLR